MAFRHESNGESTTTIDFIERPGYVYIAPQDLAHLPANIALILNAAFLEWLKRNSTIRVRTVLPITQDGQTTAIHLWYDRADDDGWDALAVEIHYENAEQRTVSRPVCRGGNYFDVPGNARCAVRLGIGGVTYSDSRDGFRLCLGRAVPRQ